MLRMVMKIINYEFRTESIDHLCDSIAKKTETYQIKAFESRHRFRYQTCLPNQPLSYLILT
ncbi:hypothetical protein QR98_0082480 [Sarcoptes scabiei]|uniref:Uncharacterized protein n=1 Tax=Sarcoptes scabiei TaxID=52283 RepID=A0A132AFD9_SARSC|nr:hypothetical protein QR98_0082480 [Sarcoptes scabiei]